MPADPKVHARVLSPADVDTLLARLRDLVSYPVLNDPDPSPPTLPVRQPGEGYDLPKTGRTAEMG
jgi:hypothetical protein